MCVCTHTHTERAVCMSVFVCVSVRRAVCVCAKVCLYVCVCNCECVSKRVSLARITKMQPNRNVTLIKKWIARIGDLLHALNEKFVKSSCEKINNSIFISIVIIWI